MKSLNYWEQFTLSGKVEDYLRYASRVEEEESEDRNKRSCADETGVRLHAGICNSDRNDIEADTCGGI